MRVRVREGGQRAGYKAAKGTRQLPWQAPCPARQVEWDLAAEPAAPACAHTRRAWRVPPATGTLTCWQSVPLQHAAQSRAHLAPRLLAPLSPSATGLARRRRQPAASACTCAHSGAGLCSLLSRPWPPSAGAKRFHCECHLSGQRIMREPAQTSVAQPTTEASPVLSRSACPAQPMPCRADGPAHAWPMFCTRQHPRPARGLPPSCAAMCKPKPRGGLQLASAAPAAWAACLPAWLASSVRLSVPRRSSMAHHGCMLRWPQGSHP